MNNIQLSKFSLQSFDTPPAAGAAKRPYMPPSLVQEKVETAATPAAPVFSEAQLKAAEQEAYRKGFLEGTNEGQMQAKSEQAEIDRNLTQVVEALSGRVHEVILQYNAFIAQERAEMPKLALMVARKVAGDALRENAAPLVEATVFACIERLLGEPNISITVNKSLSDALEARLATRFSGNNDPGEITIQGDPELPPGDCRIEWARGKAERNTENIWQEVEALVKSMIEAGVPPAPQTTEQTPPTNTTEGA